MIFFKPSNDQVTWTNFKNVAESFGFSQLDIVVSWSVPFFNFTSWIIHFLAFKRMSKKMNKLCKNLEMLNCDYSKLDLVPGTGMLKIFYF